MLFGRVVYQDVDLAELLHGLLDSFSTELFLADITCDQQTFAPVFFHQTPGFIRVLVLFEIDNRNVRTFFRKGYRNRAANPAVPASNERHFVSQFSTAAMFFVLGPWRRLHIVFAAGLSLLMLRRLKFLLLGHLKFSCDGFCWIFFRRAPSETSIKAATACYWRRFRVRAAFPAAAERERAERRPAARFACCDNAFLDADRRLSRLSAPLVARERLREGFLPRPARPFAKSRLA